MSEGQMNPLIETTDHLIETWLDWKEAWNATDVACFHESLLRTGFDTGLRVMYDHERLKCYLDVADGWKKSSYRHMTSAERVQAPGADPSNGHPWEIRKHLARVAFQVLCRQAFRFRKGESSELSLHCIYRELSLNDILDFFLRQDDGHYYNLPNDKPRDHHEQTAYTFLRLLIDSYWDEHLDELPRWRNQGLPERRLRLAELMVALESLDLLLIKKRHRTITKDCFSAMTRQTLQMVRFPSNNALPKNLKAAVHWGSDNAQMLILLRVMQTQEKRLSTANEESEAAQRA